ncbi:MAG: type II toxin-antitoxin system HipA family toxin [Deltaproteobacteria bacterium]|nr:type II toxin-antitoxin system HipA family toxin [Deltaproteobacteria bacterium]
MSESLHLWYEDEPVGSLWREGEALRFVYAADWLAREGAFALSLSIPLAEGEQGGPAVAHFFANLLPEGFIRQSLAERMGLSVDNDFALLSALGADCAGALQILPPGEQPGAKGGPPRKLSPARWKRLLASPPVFAALVEDGRLRLSLAGAQDKLPVLLPGGKPALPASGAASSHLLKFGGQDFVHLPANEVYCNMLAAAAGLRVAETRLIRLGGQEVALIRRYDRRADEGRLRRLHQEDFCQALGFSHHRKYEQEGGPGFEDCFALLERVSAEPLPDIEQLLGWLIFNLLVGNADGHAKNISLIYEGPGRPRLAPFYDLVCTAAYRRLDRRAAMAVGGQADPGQVARAHWERLAERVGLGRAFLLGEVRHLAEDLPRLAREQAAAFQVAYGEHPILQMVQRPLRRRARRCLDLLED